MSAADRPPMTQRERRMWIYRIAGPGGALAMALLALLLFRSPVGAHGLDGARVAAGLGIVVFIMAWSLAFSVLTARHEDEYTLAAAQFAWFWGGLIGLACSVPVLALLLWGGVPLAGLRLRPDTGPAPLLVLGYALPLVFQMLGFVAARAWWGFRR